MESTNFMQIVPNQEFTIGDKIEIEILQLDRTWKTEVGRVCNDLENKLMLSIGDIDNGCWTNNYISNEYMRNPKLIEKGPWHDLICNQPEMVAYYPQTEGMQIITSKKVSDL